MTDPSDISEPDDLAYRAWCVIANASDWRLHDDPEVAVWRAAAERWRDDFHRTLP